ncbi:MAG TPA: hypothetical protein EYP85_14760 [Armatimonadetes bacterium]|nr:hypothetical protein [Armatimonadota bacterium]
MSVMLPTSLLWGMFASPSVRAAEPTPQFRAGAALSNITPWLGLSINGGMQDRIATHIHDELYARCLVLDDGTTRLAIVICDSCMIPREIFDEAKRLVQQHTGLPPAHMLMAATHTHSAPAATSVFQSDPEPEYQRFLARRIADGVRRALNNLAPARLGWGVGQVPEQVFNRRWWMKPGTIPPDPFGRRTDKVKMNPPPGSPNLVKPAGPTDPELVVVSVQSPEGRPIALLANYSLHYVGGTGPGHISADYFGLFADRIQELLGADRLDPPFVALMSNGTSGDINNLNFRKPRQRKAPYEQMRLVANEVAAEAYRVCQNIQYHDWVPLEVRQTTLELGVRLPNPAEVEQARQIIARAQGPFMRTLAEIYARETVLLSEYPEKVELILQALRMGDLGIVAVPCEVFVEIGLEIKQRSPFKPTFTVQLANGYNGYLPTVEHHKLGGYETWRARSSYLEVEAAPKVVRTLLSLLGELKQQGTRRRR